MPDNTGPYVSVARMLAELGNAELGTVRKVVLSGKAGNSFTFATSGTNPAVGDFIVQGEYHSLVTNVAGSTVTVQDATNLVDGSAKAVTTDLEETDVQKYITDAMAFIDRHTRQWFNKRTFSRADGNSLKIEGNNARVLFFPVPIIQIDSLRKNNSEAVLDTAFYRVHKSRQMPDDRRNPMIKLLHEDNDVLNLNQGNFLRGTYTEIEGSFGFLEPDGSTPTLITRATLKLSLMRASRSLGAAAQEAANSTDKGSIKREKTDLHEIEYYDPNSATKSSAVNIGSGLSGDDEVDDIIASYKGPPIVSGTFPDIGVESPIIWSVTRSL